jgi:DNA-binding SARP family transcriptional activator/DNA-binding beta-propeller fold protein YncE
VEFRILGPLEVVGGANGVSLDAPKVRALLGVMLLHPNEVVSLDRLIDELWGERPPATAAKIVQTYVSQLRHALGADAIATRAPGYVLLVENEALDADAFRRLVAEARGFAATGDDEQACDIYREALALWRGPPLAGVVFESFARNEVERLDEERLSAVMDLADVELELGRHEEVVPELESLVGQHPLRERLRAQLMLALYRCGRQAEALAIYRDARRTLVEELGLEPGRELQALEQSILTHDRDLQAPSWPGAREQPGPRPRKPGRLLVGAAALVLIAVGVSGLAFLLNRGPPASIRLLPDSVGFIDGKSGRVTRSYPVGREPSALTVVDQAVWVANYEDQTVTRVDPASGRGLTIAVGGHPTGIAGSHGVVWVWTQEGLLVPVDPRYDSADHAVRLTRAASAGVELGRVAAGGGFLWISVPEATLIRVDPAHPERRSAIDPDWGAEGPIVDHNGRLWVAGSGSAAYVFPIADRTRAVGSGIPVGGPIRGLAFVGDTLWVLSGGPAFDLTPPAVRSVDVRDQLVRSTVTVGKDPVGVAAAADSIWVANRGDRTISRVDPSRGGVVATIKLGARPAALTGDREGVWVAVG